MLVVFVGPPGAGKGTQAKRLVSSLELLHLSTGEILRGAVDAGTRLGELARGYINQGLLVPDKIVVDLICSRLTREECDHGCLLDGFPRTLPQARALDQMLAEQDRRVDLVLAMKVDRDELLRRLIGRADTEGRQDDTPDTIRHRLAIYDELTSPLIEHYKRQGVVREIEAMGTTDEVFDRILQAVEETRRGMK